MNTIIAYLTWGKFIVVGWFFVLIMSSIGSLVKVDDYFIVRSIEVIGGPTAYDTFMKVDREIKQDFEAEWRVEIEKWNGNGWVLVCFTPHTPSHYAADNELPNPLRLSWWAYGANDADAKNRPCPYETGTYRILTSWDLKLFGFEKTVKKQSNDFTITKNGENNAS